jgi:hypothetical protein
MEITDRMTVMTRSLRKYREIFVCMGPWGSPFAFIDKVWHSWQEEAINLFPEFFRQAVPAGERVYHGNGCV